MVFLERERERVFIGEGKERRRRWWRPEDEANRERKKKGNSSTCFLFGGKSFIIKPMFPPILFLSIITRMCLMIECNFQRPYDWCWFWIVIGFIIVCVSSIAFCLY